MGKPSWIDAPSRANWLAQDPDGEWYWYQLRPRINEGAWDEDSYMGSIWRAGRTDRQENWQKSLERRP